MNKTTFSGCPPPSTGSVSQPFSTTAWADGTALTVSVKVHQSDGQWAQATSTGPVAWNKGYCMYNVEFGDLGGDCDEAAATYLSAMHHAVTDGWCYDSNITILGTDPEGPARLKYSSVAYLGTHGDFTSGRSSLHDCTVQVPDPDSGWMYATTDIADAVEAKSSSPAVPDIFNFVFADACYSACGACFSDCDGGNCEQNHGAFRATAYLGWTSSIGNDQMQVDFTVALWLLLSQQYCVRDARFAALQFVHNKWGSEADDFPLSMILGNGYIPCQGDYKVHWVAPTV